MKANSTPTLVQKQSHVASEHISVCGAAPSTVPIAPGDMHSQSHESATNGRPKRLKIAASAEAVGIANDTDGSHVRIDHLPDEILIEIFSYMSFREVIDVINKVCSRWKRLSQDFALCGDKEYNIGSQRCYYSDTKICGATDKEAIQTIQNAPGLRTVRMWRRVSVRVFHALYSLKRLSVLELHPTQRFSYLGITNLVQNCSRIHTLRISSELMKCEKFSKAVSQLQHLKVLLLDLQEISSAPVLWPLGDGCQRLAAVNSGQVTVPTDEMSVFLNAKKDTLEFICMDIKVRAYPLLSVCGYRLEHLCVQWIAYHGARETFTTVGSMDNLKELEITIIPKQLPTGTFALAYSTGLPKLGRLDLQLLFGLEDDIVPSISQRCPELRELIIRHNDLLTDAAFFEIFRLQYLEELEVSCCSGLGADFLPCISKLPRLRTLQMEALDFRKMQPGVRYILQLSGVRYLSLNYSIVIGVPFEKFPGQLVSLGSLSIVSCQGDPKATDRLTELMPDLKIRGTIEEPTESTPPLDGSPSEDYGGDINSSDCESDGGKVFWE